MFDHHLDFRSDTAAWPSAAMRAAMAEAPVGDDVFGEDPTVNRLQERIAEKLGKEAAVYVPSGSMANAIAARLHCDRDGEILMEAGSHVFHYEQASYAQLSGLAVRAVEGREGVLERARLEGLVRPDNTHFSRTQLLWLENTHNRAGGKVLPYDTLVDLCDWARERGLAIHMDGARLFNAVVATGVEAPKWTRHVDTVTVCFSKGLGAPIGSALVGTREAMAEARRHRKLLGGAMRQAGVIAAAALYALENNVERLAEDHANARRLADAIRSMPRLRLTAEAFDTNLVFFDVDPAWGTAAELSAALAERGPRMSPVGPRTLRAALHLDIRADDVGRAITILREVLDQGRPCR
ncbi:MAG: aminotransferase class I/II-fold pyridoxal phosphate-dependent enzyme [Pirellulales bacterium]|nr:aminotransferase class I/II-fold pyridoxal phosphate-dependent enzyme [Pirellulales bacterium]